MSDVAIMSAIDASNARSGAWSNPFFERSSRAAWSRADLQIICPEYLAFTKSFPKTLSKLIARLDDDWLRAILVEILHSELGLGKPERAHARLFVRLMEVCGVVSEVQEKGRLSSTAQLIEGLATLYSENPLAVALGAQYALEHQADNMLRCLSTGFRKIGLPDAALEFFAVHEDEEKNHIDLMRKALIEHLQRGALESELMFGAKKCTTLFENFWAGLLQALPQPSPA